MTNLAGSTDDDVRVWRTYMFWARSAFGDSLSATLDIANPNNRISSDIARWMQAIVFAAFVLEYRIKRVYDELGVTYGPKDPLGLLLEGFQRKIEQKTRLDDGRPILLPRGWPRLYARLSRLKDHRNAVAHAKFAELRALLGNKPSEIERRARVSYNAVVDFMSVSSQAVGYEPLSGRAARQYYSSLRLP